MAERDEVRKKIEELYSQAALEDIPSTITKNPDGSISMTLTFPQKAAELATSISEAGLPPQFDSSTRHLLGESNLKQVLPQIYMRSRQWNPEKAFRNALKYAEENPDIIENIKNFSKRNNF